MELSLICTIHGVKADGIRIANRGLFSDVPLNRRVRERGSKNCKIAAGNGDYVFMYPYNYSFVREQAIVSHFSEFVMRFTLRVVCFSPDSLRHSRE